MLAYLLQELEMPSIGKDKSTMPSNPVVAMVLLAVAVVQAVGTGATVEVVGEAATEKVEVAISQKRTNSGAEQSERWPAITAHEMAVKVCFI